MGVSLAWYTHLLYKIKYIEKDIVRYTKRYSKRYSKMLTWLYYG